MSEYATPSEIEAYWDRVPCGSLHPDPTWQRYFVQPHIKRFAEFWKWKNKCVLEIGCGIGTDTIQFMNSGAFLDVVDLSEKSIEITKKRVFSEASLNCPLGYFFCANAEEFLPTGWIGYDLIYSFGVLHHTPYPEKILKLAHERLDDDGQLRIMLYAKYSIKHLFRIQPEAQKGCPLVRWYSGWEARKLLWDCGFKVISIEKTHIFPWKIKDYVEHRFVKHWYYRWMPNWMFRSLERLLGHHLLLIARKS